MVAMLDIYIALFTFLTYYLALTRRFRLGILALSLGVTTKFNGGFPYPALLAKIARDIGDKLKFIAYLVLSVMVPILILFTFSIPLIANLGFSRWWNEAIVGAIRWHLSIKTLGGPPQSAPWEWFLGINPFPLHLIYDPETQQWVADLIAKGNPPLYILTLALSLLLIPVFKELPDEGFTYVYTWVTYLMYVAIWFLGARTQYSFYMVQIVPLIYTLLFIEVYYIVTPINRIIYVLRSWKEMLSNLRGNIKRLIKEVYSLLRRILIRIR